MLVLLFLSIMLAGPASAAAMVADAYEPDGSYGAARPLTPDGSPQQHTVYPQGDEDWVSFSVVAGHEYVLQTAEGTSPETVDTVLYLYDSNGTTELAYDDDGGSGTYSLITYVSDADKTVYARIRAYFSASVGAYALSVTVSTPEPEGDSYEPDDSWATATTIVVDGPAQQHTIDPEDDEDWVSISVEAGWQYSIATSAGSLSGDVDTVLSLYGSDGATQLAYDDDGNGSGYSLLEYTADADGTVYARVYGWSGTGGYALSVTAVTYVWDAYEPDDSWETASTIATDGTPQQHNILPPSDQDWVAFSVTPGWRYTIETGPGTPVEDTDTILRLYEADGVTLIAEDNDGGDTGYFSRIVYDADAAKTIYARVTAYYTDGSTYALSVTGFAVPRIAVPASVDFGEVEVGAASRQTVPVANTGAGPLAIGALGLEGDGFSIVGDDAGEAAIPPGESRDVEVQYSPSTAYTGPPAAVKQVWTNLVVQYNYTGGVLTSFSLYSGFENRGGAGDLEWQVRIGAQQTTGSETVVAGGRYTVRTQVSKGASAGSVELLQPVTDSWDFHDSLGTLMGVAYIRVPDAFLTIPSDDPDNPEAVVGLYGVAVPTGSDTIPPVTSHDYDGAWHSEAVTVRLTAEDAGGSGMSGGLARTEYSTDGGESWSEGTEVTYTVWRRGGGSGVHTLLYRSTDAAGNTEDTQSVDVKIDARPPLTGDDAPLEPQAGPLTVHFTAADSLFGVADCSGLAATWYALDGGDFTQGDEVTLTNPGLHWIAYFSTDNAGNAEYVQWCPVTVLAAASDTRGADRAPGRAVALRSVVPRR